MKMIQYIGLGSTLALLGLAGACDRQNNSQLDIVRGRPLGPDSPALNNVVGLSADGTRTFCTGSLVAKDMVVTAAHCVENRNGFYVVFGQPNGLMEKIEAEKVETYKPYGAAAFPNFDIAWVKLKKEVPERFKPMEILRDPSRLKKAKEIRLAGYGMEKTACREASCVDELLETNTALDQYYDTARLMSLMVFKGPAEQGFGGACDGDSGGPAYARIDDRWYLIGVTNGVTAYINPENFTTTTVSCETGSDIYTFMGDYVPWLEKRSSQELLQRPEINPDRSEAPFVIKGEQLATDAPEPQTWAEWIQYPYHNTQAWNTVEKLLFDLWTKQRSLMAQADHVKLWVDPEFSEARVQEITSFELTETVDDALRIQELPSDLRPLGSWSGLQEVSLIGEAAYFGVQPVSRLPALRQLTLIPGSWRPYGNLNLEALQKLSASLKKLTLVDFRPVEIKTLPFATLNSLESLQFLAQKGEEAAVLDLSGLRNLKQLHISSWDYAAKITLPKDLALESLSLKLNHVTDLKWLDVESLASVQTLEFGYEVLNEPLAITRFQNKGVQKLVVPGSRLNAENFKAAGFADVQELNLNGNLFSGTAFMKALPVLKKADLRDNPLTATECPVGVICNFDRVPNPKTVAEFCRNTADSAEYGYAPLVKMLLMAQGYPTTLTSDSVCDALQRILNSKTALELDGNLTWHLPHGLNYDMRVLKGLSGLKTLSIRNATLANADALAELPGLMALDLGAVTTKSLGFISKISKLENLNYTEFPYTNLEGLSHPNLKVLMLSSEGRAVMNAGRVQTIGVETVLPALTKLSLRGNPLRDLKGVESMKALSQLDITETKVSDLSPLNVLIGATVFFGSNYELNTCPILYGSCQTGSKTLDGANFGSGAGTLMGSKWIMGQAIPGLGKALRN